MAGRKADSWSECDYQDGDFTALASFTSEASLLAGKNNQPLLPGDFLMKDKKKVRYHAWGVLGSTSTPTYTWQCRLGSTVGSATLSGASIGVSAAVTTGSGVSTQLWELWLDIWVKTIGQSTNNLTLNCAGWIVSYGGFAAPYGYALAPTTPPTATITATIDGSVNNWFNLSVTCSASSASNTVTCKGLSQHCLN